MSATICDGSIPLQIKIVVYGILGSKLNFTQTYQITQDEANHFSLATLLVSNKLINEDVNIDKLSANVFFTENGQLTLRQTNDVLGTYLPPSIIYPMKKIRDKISSMNSSSASICQLQIFIEELVHCFWSSIDEDFVSHKVHEIIQAQFPSIEYSDIYR